MTSQAVLRAVTAGTWPASLELRLARRGESTRLSRCRHQGPLYVQRAFYPEGEDLAHLYLLHPPGGVVSGDALHIRVDCEPDSRALITTPGAGRIYRARETLPQQRQRVDLRLEPGASLEWFPLETIVYDGACVDMATDVQLATGSRFIGWEISCFGLPAAGELFTRGSFRQRYRVHRDGVPLFVDGLDVDEGSCESLLHGPAAMRGCAVSGFFLAGPFDRDNFDPDALDRRSPLHGRSIEPEFESQSPGMPDHAERAPTTAITLVGDMVVGRYLGPSAEGARRQFTRWWQQLRPALLNREACAPRIWLT